MSNVPTQPSPALWSFFILLGGLLLAVPFLKGRSHPTSPYEIPAASQAAVAAGTNSAKQLWAQPLMDWPEIPAARPGATIGLVRPNPARLPSTDSVKPVKAPISESPETGVPEQSPVELLPPRPSLPLDSYPTEQPKPPTRIQSDLAEKQLAAKIGTVRLTPELPAWAKKPSLLDSLLSGKESAAAEFKVSSSDQRPSSFQTWTQANAPVISTNAHTQLDSTNRVGPPLESVQTHVETPPRDQAEFRWPDEEPNALVIVAKPKNVGKDAIIRDRAALEIAAQAQGVSPGLAHSASAPIASLAPPQPGHQFGKPPTTPNTGAPTIGAKLRSRLPPASNDYISQPR